MPGYACGNAGAVMIDHNERNEMEERKTQPHAIYCIVDQAVMKAELFHEMREALEAVVAWAGDGDSFDGCFERARTVLAKLKGEAE